MHSAPAVSYPVGRSRFQGWLVGLTGLVGVLVVLLWGFAADTAGWRHWLCATAVLGTCSLGGEAWRRSPVGSLRWDGQAWGWHTANASTIGILTVHLDLQAFLVLSLRTGAGARIWLWPERRSEAAHWSALCRAVFSRRGATHAHDANAGDDRAQVKS